MARIKARKRLKSRIPIAVLPKPGEALVLDPVYANRRPGHPTMVSEQALQTFLMALRGGNLRKDAAIYAGLSESSVKQWIHRGQGLQKDRPATPPYVRFYRLVIEAEAAAKVLATSNLLARSSKDTAAALAFLQTRYPEDWPRQQGSGPIGTPEQVSGVTIDNRTQQVVVLDAEAMPELVASILAARRAERAAGEPPPTLIEEVPQRGTRHARLDALRVETDERPG